MNGSYHALVVGGGIAGTFAAWRLKTGAVPPGSSLPSAPAQRNIALFELSDRIGGRLQSIVPPGMQNLRAEFGGMAFSNNDTMVNRLVDEFGLPTVEFQHGDSHNLFYLRGKRFTVAQAKDPKFVPPYDLAKGVRGTDPRKLVGSAVERVFPGSSKWTRERWNRATSKPYNGRDLNDIGFWNFLSENMTNEELSYARDAYGHFFEVANWNCAQALPWFMLDGTAKCYRALAKGYDQLPQTLAARFAKAGGKVSMSTQVASVEAQGQTIEVETTNGRICTAAAVVLALPRRALELLSSNVLAEPRVQALIGSVTGQPVMKAFCCYDKPWWQQQLQISSGSSSTDLPIGQVWYFGPDSDTNAHSLLLAAYNDTLDTTFWEGLATGPTFPSGNGDIDAHWAGQAPSAYMVEQLQVRLAEMHGLSSIPEPYSASWRDWSQDPYGGAFNTWNVGVKADEVAKAILQPDPSVPLYICGEAYSHDQGWVEGALETAEQVVVALGVGAYDGTATPVSPE